MRMFNRSVVSKSWVRPNLAIFRNWSKHRKLTHSNRYLCLFLSYFTRNRSPGFINHLILDGFLPFTGKEEIANYFKFAKRFFKLSWSLADQNSSEKNEVCNWSRVVNFTLIRFNKNIFKTIGPIRLSRNKKIKYISPVPKIIFMNDENQTIL